MSFVKRALNTGFAAVLVTGVLSATPAVAPAAEVCARSSDMPALQARVLQTDLMVAALTCDDRAQYNAFVTKHQAELVKRGHELKGFFTRSYGKRGQASLDSFVTRLANEASLVTMRARAAYCASANAVFSTLLDATPKGGMSAVAAHYPRAAMHGIRRCGIPEQKASADR